MTRLGARGLAALLAAGVAVIALALWVSSRTPSASAPRAGEPVLPGLESSINAITAVRISKGDGTRTTLERGASDWIVGERGFPADSSRVRKLLLDLADLKIVEGKTSDPANYAQLGVEDVSSPRASGTLIELIEPGRPVSLIVGKPSGMQSSYVRPAGAAQSLLVSPQVIPDADPRHWLPESVIDLPETRIEDVRVEPAAGPPYTVVRHSPNQLDFAVPDLPKGRQLASVTAPNAVAEALASLTLEDVRKAGGPGPPPAPAVHATFHTFDGLTVEVSGRSEGDSRYLTVSAQSSSKTTEDEARQLNSRFGGWQIEVLGERYDALFQPLEGLLAKAPAPKAHGSRSRRNSRAAGEKPAG